jgi:hypothetical protein
MSKENTVLVSNYSYDNEPSTFFYSEKQKGAGYHRYNDGVHTVVFQFDNFKGSVKMQATLALYPGDNDWFDVTYDTISTSLDALDSTPLVGTANCTFTGKFTWIRAAYQLEQGTITEIRYNY